MVRVKSHVIRVQKASKLGENDFLSLQTTQKIVYGPISTNAYTQSSYVDPRQQCNIMFSLFFIPPDKPALLRDYHYTVKPLYNGHIGPCKTGPYNEVASLLR